MRFLVHVPRFYVRTGRVFCVCTKMASDGQDVCAARAATAPNRRRRDHPLIDIIWCGKSTECARRHLWDLFGVDFRKKTLLSQRVYLFSMSMSVMLLTKQLPDLFERNIFTYICETCFEFFPSTFRRIHFGFR